MFNSRTARTQIKKLACISTNNPSFYFVHGFFVGLAINPETIPPSTWLPKLFGELNVVDEKQLGNMDGVMWQHNKVMQQAIDFSIKLPAQCKLSPTNFAESLKSDAPLPQWCNGLLKAFKLINKQKLTKSQKDLLSKTDSFFSDFLSIDKLEKHFKPISANWQGVALEMRRYMVYEIYELLSLLRFANNGSHQHSEFPVDTLENDTEFNALDETFEFALYDDSAKAHIMMEALIKSFEQKMGPAYFEENAGHFWLINETHPYMQLRSRRAGLKFEKGQTKEAAEELKALIVLNPNDNQGLRIPLSSWLIIQQNWSGLADLLALYADEISLPMLAAKALLLYAQEGDSAKAKKAKKQMHQSNKHAIKYLTGQKKAKHTPEFYQLGDASEAEMYVAEYAKQAWRSVPGALFWLRKV
ncbi:MAG: yecA family protein [Paraglaciecola sp.]|jgi:yecA family protein